MPRKTTAAVNVVTTEKKTRKLRAKKIAAPLTPEELSALFDDIHSHARQYLTVQETRIAFSNRIWKMEHPRDGHSDVVFPTPLLEALRASLDATEQVEKNVGKALANLVKQHPFFNVFVESHDGIGHLGVGSILGKIDSLDRYPMVSSLWHYCGGNNVDGHAVKRLRGMSIKPRGADGKSDPYSYNPRARTILWRQADAAIKHQNEYRALYDAERAKILARPRIGSSGCPFGHTHEEYARRQTPSGKRKLQNDAKIVAQCIRIDKETGKEISAHVNNHCRRIVWKRILLQLWTEWQNYKKLLRDHAA